MVFFCCSKKKKKKEKKKRKKEKKNCLRPVTNGIDGNGEMVNVCSSKSGVLFVNPFFF